MIFDLLGSSIGSRQAEVSARLARGTARSPARPLRSANARRRCASRSPGGSSAIHRSGDYGLMIAAARRTGIAGYVGDVRWPAIHRLDAATLFRLALERGPAGNAYHGAAETVKLRTVAEIIGDRLDLPVRVRDH